MRADRERWPGATQTSCTSPLRNSHTLFPSTSSTYARRRSAYPESRTSLIFVIVWHQNFSSILFLSRDLDESSPVKRRACGRKTVFLETDLSGVKLQVSTTSAAIGSHGVTVFPGCFHASPKAAFGLPFKPCGGCWSRVVGFLSRE